jgi:hypothetical protein
VLWTRKITPWIKCSISSSILNQSLLLLTRPVRMEASVRFVWYKCATPMTTLYIVLHVL